jgi:ABC-2 type transport system ATP-binding protein
VGSITAFTQYANVGFWKGKMTDWIIECQRLTKSFRDQVALADCDLRVQPFSIVGLLGPNGAGKTTLLRTLLGFQRPTRGSASVCGYDCVSHSLDVRRHVAYLPGEARLFRSMTGDGVLEIFGGLSPHGDYHRSLAVARRLDLDVKRRVMFMSTGMRQKLALAIVLGSQAPLVILDEPTANLDPNVRGEVIAMVREIRADERTVLMSSHIFSDIEDTCDEVVILRNGRLVHQQRLSGLDQLHVIHAAWTAVDADLATWTKDREFVVYQSLVDGKLDLQLSGAAQCWLAWLAQLPTDNLRIERASVSSIYSRFHGS